MQEQFQTDPQKMHAWVVGLCRKNRSAASWLSFVGNQVPIWIADRVKTAHPAFDAETFLCEVCDGYDDLELTPRGWRIAHCLHRHLAAKYPEQTLARLRQWANDDNVHVRRLVSEGTRPRLPWASRLALFQHDPGPVLELLELL